MKGFIVIVVLIFSLTGYSQEELDIFDKSFNSRNKELEDEEFKKQVCWNKAVKIAIEIEQELCFLTERGFDVVLINRSYGFYKDKMPLVLVAKGHTLYYIIKIENGFLVSSYEPSIRNVCYILSLKRPIYRGLYDESRILIEANFGTKETLISYIAMVDRERTHKD